MTDLQLTGFMLLLLAKGAFDMHHTKTDPTYEVSVEDMEIDAVNLIKFYTEYEVRNLANNKDLFRHFFDE